ncbi:MAG TPA: RHS repeat-associated core domain-containing protein, partial [Nitrospira sp.]|nr:RHS repeat-associated core domain-containing protein [Nitrospira sp.]
IYQERYVYDAVGNFLEMQHVGSDPAHPGWTRTYTYAEPSLIEDGTLDTVPKINNRLSSTTVGANNPTVERYFHDSHGNMIRMPHLGGADPAQNMHWNYRDQLCQTDLGGGGMAYYVYDAAGQRTRKICEKAPGLIEERIYLGGFEIFRQHDGGRAITLERETLHVMDDKQRIALIETKTIDVASPLTTHPLLIRYQLSNHLGSASVELDEAGEIISYEEYHPYGTTSYQALDKASAAEAKRYRYTGMERDEETGLEYHGARYYASWMGRWTAVDPIASSVDLNRYRFVRGNPIALYDPNGKWPVLPLLLWMLSDNSTTGVLPDGEPGIAQTGSWATSAMAAPLTSVTSQGPQSTLNTPQSPNRGPIENPAPPRGAPQSPNRGPINTPTAPRGSPRIPPPPGSSPVGLVGSGLVGVAIAGMILAPALEYSRPCDPAKCGLDFSTDHPEDQAIWDALYQSPMDQILAGRRGRSASVTQTGASPAPGIAHPRPYDRPVVRNNADLPTDWQSQPRVLIHRFQNQKSDAWPYHFSVEIIDPTAGRIHVHWTQLEGSGKASLGVLEAVTAENPIEKPYLNSVALIPAITAQNGIDIANFQLNSQVTAQENSCSYWAWNLARASGVPGVPGDPKQKRPWLYGLFGITAQLPSGARD